MMDDFNLLVEIINKRSEENDFRICDIVRWSNPNQRFYPIVEIVFNNHIHARAVFHEYNMSEPKSFNVGYNNDNPNSIFVKYFYEKQTQIDFMLVQVKRIREQTAARSSNSDSHPAKETSPTDSKTTAFEMLPDFIKNASLPDFIKKASNVTLFNVSTLIARDGHAVRLSFRHSLEAFYVYSAIHNLTDVDCPFVLEFHVNYPEAFVVTLTHTTTENVSAFEKMISELRDISVNNAKCNDTHPAESPLKHAAEVTNNFEQSLLRAIEAGYRETADQFSNQPYLAAAIADATNMLVDKCHRAATDAGWWKHPTTGEDPRDNPLCFSNKLMLIVSEISEAMEGDRKNKMDDHLPHRPSREVELADALIRICDLAGAYGLQLGGAVAEKMAYNAKRADHKPENRAKDGGKAY